MVGWHADLDQNLVSVSPPKMHNFASLDTHEANLMMFFCFLYCFIKYLRVCDALGPHSYVFTICSNGSANRLNMELLQISKVYLGSNCKALLFG
jgi:hypothetical protein